jgi:hypothetical protein
VPVLPGREHTDEDWMEEMSGPRAEEYERTWQEHGVKRHAVWHQETPDGTVAIIYMEADDVGRAMQAIATSDAPFDQWFRERVKDVHGIDLSAGPPPKVEQIHDRSF